jgi:glutamate formiminotransferase
VERAREIAREVRTLGVKALGLELRTAGIVQVSTNIEDHTKVTAADVVAEVAKHANVTGAELVAPAPRAALADFPPGVPLRGPSPLEDQLPS